MAKAAFDDVPANRENALSRYPILRNSNRASGPDFGRILIGAASKAALRRADVEAFPTRMRLHFQPGSTIAKHEICGGFPRGSLTFDNVQSMGQARPRAKNSKYLMLPNSASGPEVGLPGRTPAGF